MRPLLPTVLLASALAALGLACESAQLRAVRRFNDEADLRQVACLDVNGDGRVDGGDAEPALPDITGDDRVTESDLSLVREVQFVLPDGPPGECDGGRGPDPDWQVSPPHRLDCSSGERGALLLAVGGGAVDLGKLENAAGARWMVEGLSAELDELGLPAQIASIAPRLNGTSAGQADAERWAFVYLAQRLSEQPCLQAVILGHSHGGVLATATAARLEEAGLGGQILLTVLVDRATALYTGDTESLPRSSRVFNVYLPPAENEVRGAAIDQPNVENWDASAVEAPEHGEDGGELKPANHSTIDNSPAVLEEVRKRVVAAFGSG